MGYGGIERAAARPSRRALVLVLVMVASLFGIVTPLVAPAVAPAANAVSGADFNPAYIVSDDQFFDGDALSAADIQNFLNAKEPGSCGNSYCLKNYHADTFSIPADPMCKAYPGAPNESAATMIYKVATTCGISPKTLLVTLQKEQGLITKLTPSQSNMDHATGVQCPDTGSCDPAYSGFFKQVHGAAYWMKRYTQPAGTGAGTAYTTRFDLAYPVGVPHAIQYKPGCAAPVVTIQNRATHVLYVYTPYQPNAAALANLGGSGDDCSSYGNRNFWYYWSSWWGSPTVPTNSPYGAITSVTTSQDSIVIRGWALDSDSDNPISVHAYAEDTFEAAGSANSTDASLLNGGIPIYWPTAAGTAHAYTITVTNAPPGTHNWCVWGLNAAGTDGGAASTSCTIATVPFCGGGYACPSVPRISDVDRYTTSVQVANAAFPTTAPVAYVTTGLNFADALAAAPAAAADGGPLLLTDPKSLPSAVKAKLTSLHPSRVVVVGGPAAVSDAVLAAIAGAVPAASITRVFGADRFATSRAIAESLSTKLDLTHVYVVTGENFPDALSADSVASFQKRPVLLVPGSNASLNAETTSFFTTHDVTDATILGGTVAVSAGVESSLDAISGLAVDRVAGSDRYAVSQSINKAVFGSTATTYLANGQNFPDALSGAVLSSMKGVPMYLAHPDCVPASILGDVFGSPKSTITLIGGTAALFPSVAVMTECVN